MSNEVGAAPAQTQKRYGYGQGVLSNSILGIAGQCGHKYQMKYVLGQEPTLTMSYFAVGSIVHWCIEDYFNSDQTTCEIPQTVEKYLLERYDAHWVEKFDAPLVRRVKGYYGELQAIIDAAVKEYGKPVTRIEATKVYKEKYAHRVDQLKQEFLKEQARFENEFIFRKNLVECYEQGQTCLINFSKMQTSIVLTPSEGGEIANTETISEWRIDPPISLFGNEMPFSGAVDRIDIVTLTDGTQEYHIRDYKTGFGLWDENRIANSNQLNWYAYALYKCMGVRVKTIGIWDLLRGEEHVHHHQEQDQAAFLRRYAEEVKHFQATKELLDKYGAVQIPSDHEFNKVCKNCEFLYDPDPMKRCPFKVSYEER